MSLPERLPDFADLPIKPDYPPHSAWGVFGDDDQIGTLNLLTPERVAAAARLVKTGQVFAMNWELEQLNPPLFNRAALRHTINRRRKNVFDDVYDNFNTQSSSQWDGLRHFGHRQYGFYNGVTEEQIADQANARNGIHHWARRGVAGRGVLIDFQRFAAAHGIAFNPGERYGITPEELQAAGDGQGWRLHPGETLMLRRGWIECYWVWSKERKTQIAHPGGSQIAVWEKGKYPLPFLWNNLSPPTPSKNPLLGPPPPATPDK